MGAQTLLVFSFHPDENRTWEFCEKLTMLLTEKQLSDLSQFESEKDENYVLYKKKFVLSTKYYQTDVQYVYYYNVHSNPSVSMVLETISPICNDVEVVILIAEFPPEINEDQLLKKLNLFESILKRMREDVCKLLVIINTTSLNGDILDLDEPRYKQVLSWSLDNSVELFHPFILKFNKMSISLLNSEPSQPYTMDLVASSVQCHLWTDIRRNYAGTSASAQNHINLYSQQKTSDKSTRDDSSVQCGSPKHNSSEIVSKNSELFTNEAKQTPSTVAELNQKADADSASSTGSFELNEDFDWKAMDQQIYSVMQEMGEVIKNSRSENISDKERRNNAALTMNKFLKLFSKKSKY